MSKYFNQQDKRGIASYPREISIRIKPTTQHSTPLQHYKGKKIRICYIEKHNDPFQKPTIPSTVYFLVSSSYKYVLHCYKI